MNISHDAHALSTDIRQEFDAMPSAMSEPEQGALLRFARRGRQGERIDQLDGEPIGALPMQSVDTASTP